MTKPAEAAKPIVPAASIVIIRDGKTGLEVFMLERHQSSGQAFAGAFVFPGGKVDAEDDTAQWERLAPGTPTTPRRPFWIAAVRETFEEAGLLIARKRGASGLVGSADAIRLVAAERGQPRAGQSQRFAETIAREQLELATDHMIHFGHWITPPWPPKRFDTHFFLASAPVEQMDNFDQGESAESVWVSPQDALAQADSGKRTLVAVTRCTLELLAIWPTVAAATAAARKRKIVTVLPRMEETPAGKVLRIPVEAGYVRSELPVAGKG